MRVVIFLILLLLVSSRSGQARFLFQHFAGGAASSPIAVWTSPLGSTIAYPTGTVMGAVP